jgi:hypothetical protein
MIHGPSRRTPTTRWIRAAHYRGGGWVQNPARQTPLQQTPLVAHAEPVRVQAGGVTGVGGDASPGLPASPVPVVGGGGTGGSQTPLVQLDVQQSAPLAQ